MSAVGILIPSTDEGAPVLFDPWNPSDNIGKISMEMIGRALGRTARYNGLTSWVITVVDHTFRVVRLVEEIAGDHPQFLAIALHAMLHDAPEALVPWGDCIHGYKTEEMVRVEDGVLRALYEAIGIGHPDEEVCEIVLWADRLAFFFEASCFLPGSEGITAHAMDPGSYDGLHVHGFSWPMDISDICRFLPLIHGDEEADWARSLAVLLADIHEEFDL